MRAARVLGLVLVVLAAGCGGKGGDGGTHRPASAGCGNGVVDAGETCDQGASNSDTKPGACRTDCTPARCGDGVTDPGEACDDGNTDDTDGCNSACQRSSCGDGVVQPGEQCDQGAANSDTTPDACRTDCTTAHCGDGVRDAGEGCDRGAANSDTAPNGCRTTCTAARCGDGVVDAGELCDDGNIIDNDGCSNACRPPRCGDGIVQTGEACDSGAGNSDTIPDACRTSCRLAGCGDGVLDTGEECDDGNFSDTDACPRTCKVARCGDGVVEQAVETCDDGARNSDTTADACRTDCTPARCGDGFPDTGETCDDGNAVDTDACTNACHLAVCGDGIVEDGVEQCDQGAQNSDTIPGACRKSCRLAGCGDGVLDAGEACDDGNLDETDACTAECQLAVCGDGIVEAGVEECDDGEDNSDVDPDACRTTCKLASCGDGIIDTGEGCEDGNVFDGDGCSQSCKLEVLLPGNPVTVTATVDNDSPKFLRPEDGCQPGGRFHTYPYAAFPFVNDSGKTVQARFESANEKSDAFLVAYFAFSPDAPDDNCELTADNVFDPRKGTFDHTHDRLELTMAPGDTVTVVVTSVSFILPLNDLGTVTLTAESSICGDGVVQLSETCDDGNVEGGDGCSATCQIEPVCGNGIIEGGEGCDDGNQDDGDGCSPTCTPEFPTPGHELRLEGSVSELDQTFVRPLADCTAGNDSQAYDDRVLTNDTGADQQVRVEAVWSPDVDDHDGVVLAYVGDFDPGDPTTNCEAGGDDFDWDLDRFSTDGALDGSRTGVFTVPAHKALHVIASAKNAGNVVGPYTVYVENAGVSQQESEENATVATANAVGGDDVTQATIAAGGDLDVFSFVARQGGRYRIETSTGELGQCQAGNGSSDTTLTLLDTDGVTALGTADDGFDGSTCAVLVFEAPADGTYYVEVQAHDGASTVDPYFLEVRRR